MGGTRHFEQSELTSASRIATLWRSLVIVWAMTQAPTAIGSVRETASG
jgi:hypothetical protein